MVSFQDFKGTEILLQKPVTKPRLCVGLCVSTQLRTSIQHTEIQYKQYTIKKHLILVVVEFSTSKNTQDSHMNLQSHNTTTTN